MKRPGLAFSGFGKALGAFAIAFASQLGLLASATMAEAQSRYACSALSGGTLPVIEGEDGTFFRPDPDLIVNARFPLPIVDRIASVSEALDSRGSQLIVVPVPPRGLILSEALGFQAQTFGFDVRVAETLYDDTIKRLDAAGVATVNALDALRAWEDELPMFRSDARLTNEGIRLVAGAVAARLGNTAVANRFSVSKAEQVEVPSHQHQQIQAKCGLNIPPPVTTSYNTVSLTASVEGEEVLLAGSGLMAGEGLMARALFATAIGQDVRHIVADESPLDALIAAVASDAFQVKAPDVVVWMVPVANDLGKFGERPWREIEGMARRSCRAISSGDVVRSGGTIDVDLSDIAIRSDLALLLTLDDVSANEARFAFGDEGGLSYTRTIKRFGLAAGTERFMMPLDGRSAEGATTARVVVESGLGDVPSIAICGV